MLQVHVGNALDVELSVSVGAVMLPLAVNQKLMRFEIAFVAHRGDFLDSVAKIEVFYM